MSRPREPVLMPALLVVVLATGFVAPKAVVTAIAELTEEAGTQSASDSAAAFVTTSAMSVVAAVSSGALFVWQWLWAAIAIVMFVIIFFYLIWYVRTPRLHFVDCERNRRYVHSTPPCTAAASDSDSD